MFWSLDCQADPHLDGHRDLVVCISWFTFVDFIQRLSASVPWSFFELPVQDSSPPIRLASPAHHLPRSAAHMRSYRKLNHAVVSGLLENDRQTPDPGSHHADPTLIWTLVWHSFISREIENDAQGLQDKGF